MTKHAEARCQQRCINKLMLELLFMYGVEIHQDDGAVRTTFTKKGFKKLQKDMGLINQKLNSMKKLFAVQSNTGAIVTTGYQERHIRR